MITPGGLPDPPAALRRSASRREPSVLGGALGRVAVTDAGLVASNSKSPASADGTGIPCLPANTRCAPAGSPPQTRSTPHRASPIRPVFMGGVAGIGKDTLPSPRISFGQRGLAGARSGHRPTSAQPPTRMPEELNACGQMHDRGQIPALARDDINSQLRGFEVHDLSPAVVASGHTRHGSHLS